MKEIVAYKDFYKEIIDTINARRYKAYKSLNRHQIEHNFELSEIIVKHQEKQKWGQSIVEKLSTDITKQIDELSGYSPQKLWKMRQFYLEYREKTLKIMQLTPYSSYLNRWWSFKPTPPRQGTELKF